MAFSLTVSLVFYPPTHGSDSASTHVQKSDLTFIPADLRARCEQEDNLPYMLSARQSLQQCVARIRSWSNEENGAKPPAQTKNLIDTDVHLDCSESESESECGRCAEKGLHGRDMDWWSAAQLQQEE
jgi:hypothetical protein